MSAELRLVVFDVDGTLVDSQAHILAAMGMAFEFAGHPVPPRAAILAIVGLSLPVAIARLAPALGVAEVDRLAQHYRDAYMTLQAAGDLSPLYPGTLAMLHRLAAVPELLLGLATGKSRRGLEHVLDSHDLRRFFITQQVADDHPSKPHPSMLLAALRETGVRAEHAVMVGDTSYDMDMGRAAGLRRVGVSWGYHPPAALIAAGAERVIDHFSELDGALAQMREVAV